MGNIFPKMNKVLGHKALKLALENRSMCQCLQQKCLVLNWIKPKGEEKSGSLTIGTPQRLILLTFLVEYK